MGSRAGTGPAGPEHDRRGRGDPGGRAPPGPDQLHPAIGACHSIAASAEAIDWQQIALLYGELIRYEPTPVVEANRAVAVAMAEGPATGLVILDALAHHPQLRRWARLSTAGPTC